MIIKSKIVLIAMVALLAIGASAFVFAHSKDPTNQTAVQNQSNTNNSSISNNNNNGSNSAGTDQKLISASDAQSIAQKYIEEPGATAGTPVLKDENGEKVYVVPVILNGSIVGQINIDAQTGNNVGGAGGAP